MHSFTSSHFISQWRGIKGIFLGVGFSIEGEFFWGRLPRSGGCHTRGLLRISLLCYAGAIWSWGTCTLTLDRSIYKGVLEASHRHDNHLCVVCDRGTARGVACGGHGGGTRAPPPTQSPRWGAQRGGTDGRTTAVKTAFRFNRLEVNVLYEVYWL